MNTISIKKIGFISVVLISSMNAVNLYVANGIPDINFDITVQGEAPGLSNMRWDSRNRISGGKLTQRNGTVHVLSCCNNARHWNWISLYVNNSKNQPAKVIAIPLKFPCLISYNKASGDQLEYAPEEYAQYLSGCFAPTQILITFQKNASGQVEVHRSRLIDLSAPYGGQSLGTRAIDDILVSTLAPADYE